MAEPRPSEVPEQEPGGCALPLALVSTFVALVLYGVMRFVFDSDAEGPHMMALYYATPTFGFLAAVSWLVHLWPWIYRRLPDSLKDLVP